MADGDERTRGLDGFCASILRVFQNGPAEALVVRKPFLDLSEGANLDFWMIGCSLVHDGGRLEHVSSVDERDLAGEAGQEGRFFAG